MITTNIVEAMRRYEERHGRRATIDEIASAAPIVIHRATVARTLVKLKNPSGSQHLPLDTVAVIAAAIGEPIVVTFGTRIDK